MHNPFPGMNPYLEQPELWHQVHNRLIVAIADAIIPQIAPKYRVSIEERVYTSMEDSLLVEMIERFLEVKSTQTGALRQKDAEPVVDLQSLLNKVYERARFDLAIDYSQVVKPPLPAEEAA